MTNRILYILIFSFVLLIKGENILFSKNMPDIKDSWTVGQSENNGNIMLIRRNDGVKVINGKGFLNKRSGISFELLMKTQNGLQSDKENEKINEIEDKIFELFNDNVNSVVALIISTSGFKEFVIYHNEGFSFLKKFNNLVTLFSKYQLTTYTEDDRKWQVYNQFL